MLKHAIAIGVLAATLGFAPAQAAEMACNEADMMKMQTGVEKMPDMAKRDMAMKEMSMAKDSMTKKDEKQCMMHMQKVQGMM